MPSKYKTKKILKEELSEKSSLLSIETSDKNLNEKKGCISLKKQYESEHEAKKAILLSDRHKNINLRVYFCRDCHMWHWTTKKAY